MALGCDVVDRIDHEVDISTQQSVGDSGFVEERYGFDRGLWVDQPKALGQDGGFGLSDCASHGLELAIGIGDTDQVEVHKCQSPNATADERFCGKGTHTTESDDHDMGAEEPLHCRIAQQASDAVKTSVESVSVFEWWICHRLKLSDSSGRGDARCVQSGLKARLEIRLEARRVSG